MERETRDYVIQGDARQAIWHDMVDLQTELYELDRRREELLGRIAVKLEILEERK